MSKRFDWQETYALLERARQALEAGEARSPEEVRRILRDRAQALAKPVQVSPTPADLLDLLVFVIAGERYAIEMTYVLEVIPLRDLTPVPCTPSFVLGVVNYRGRILPVLDLRGLFGIAGQGVAEGSRVTVVEAGGMTFGIYADSVAGTVRVGAHEVVPPPVALSGGGQAFIRGFTGEMIAVLDLEALARDPRIVVNDKVG